MWAGSSATTPSRCGKARVAGVIVGAVPYGTDVLGAVIVSGTGVTATDPAT